MIFLNVYVDVERTIRSVINECYKIDTYQPLNDMTQQVDCLQSEADVLPVWVDDDTGLRVAPRKEVVEAAIEDSVRRLGGRWARRNTVV